MRKTGFSCPWHPLQMISWVITAFNIIVCSIMFSTVFKLPYSAIGGVLFFVSQASVLVSGFLVTNSDPKDITPEENISLDFSKLVCTVCMLNVNPRTKHCSLCNKCIAQFDHHCSWLNNCIGATNFKRYLCLVFSLEVNLLCILGFGALGLYYYSELRVLLWMVTVESGLVAVVNTYLLSFNLWLCWKGMTTYEYTVSRQSKVLEESNQKTSKDNQPQVVLGPSIILSTEGKLN